MDRLNRLDVRIILPHFLAIICLVFAFQSLFYLNFMEIIQTYQEKGVDGLIYLAHEKDMDFMEFMKTFMIYSTKIKYVGVDVVTIISLVVGTIISIILLMKKGSSKFNLLVVFIVCFILIRLFIDHGLAKISIKPGELLFGMGTIGLVFNMTIYTLLAIFLFVKDWSGTVAILKPAD